MGDLWGTVGDLWGTLGVLVTIFPIKSGGLVGTDVRLFIILNAGTCNFGVVRASRPALLEFYTAHGWSQKDFPRTRPCLTQTGASSG